MKKILMIFMTFMTFNNFKSFRTNSHIVDSIYLSIYSDELTYISNKPFEKVDDSWEISLPSLIIDENLTFIANAFNDKDELIYQSNQTMQLEAVDNTISIIFKSTLEYENFLISTQIVNLISEDDDTQITFKIKNPTEDNLTYCIYSDDGYEFTPDSGAVDSYDENSSYLLDINYSKPDTGGDYNNLINLVNSKKDQNISYRFILTVDGNGEVSLK